MRRGMGPDGNDIFESDTISGVPAFTYRSLASRLRTQKGRALMNPRLWIGLFVVLRKR